MHLQLLQPKDIKNIIITQIHFNFLWCNNIQGKQPLSLNDSSPEKNYTLFKSSYKNQYKNVLFRDVLKCLRALSRSLDNNQGEATD